MPRMVRWMLSAVFLSAVLAWTAMRHGPVTAAADAGRSLGPAVAGVSEVDRVRGSVRRQIGWDHAHARLLRDMPTGRDIPAALVEPGQNYAPRAMRGTTFILQSGPSGVSGHASNSARKAFGDDAAGAGVSRVHCFSTNDWLTSGYLKTGSRDNPDDWTEARVFSHSWIAAQTEHTPVLLRRVDYAIDTYDVVMAVGLNNGAGEVPHLLASAYNVISVGRSDGQHSRGGTRIEVNGRCKPEIVAPGGLTSETTPIIAGCAAALLQSADALAKTDPRGMAGHAAKSEVIKALLLGGAWKPDGWRPDAGKPLDPEWGAGQVDLDRSLLMQAGGPVEPGVTDRRYAWSFAQAEPVDTIGYRFEVDQDQGEACFTLVWNRQVAGGVVTLEHPQTGQPVTMWNNASQMPNLDLRLLRLGGDGESRVIASSTSRIDNVEVVYLRELPAGSYRLEVRRGRDTIEADWPYALAWRIEGPE
ncbi:MAG: S8 family serine peptidase [Planctomycetota bacterium]